MRTAEELRNELRGMDRRSYPAYKALAGTWQFEKYRLTIDHVQGDLPVCMWSCLTDRPGFRSDIMRIRMQKQHSEIILSVKQGDSLKNAISRPGDPARAV